MAKRKFEHIAHPFWKWEEVGQGMWSTCNNKKEMLEKAIEFTGDHYLYGKYMKKVTEEWIFSCENALTDENINRRAWIGHAACAMALSCPQDITRKAWGYLTDEQRFLANKEADAAIRLWEKHYIKNKGLRKDVDGQMLFEWYS